MCLNILGLIQGRGDSAISNNETVNGLRSSRFEREALSEQPRTRSRDARRRGLGPDSLFKRSRKLIFSKSRKFDLLYSGVIFPLSSRKREHAPLPYNDLPIQIAGNGRYPGPVSSALVNSGGCCEGDAEETRRTRGG